MKSGSSQKVDILLCYNVTKSNRWGIPFTFFTML
ncbi:hypothetical protein IBT54_003690 [Pantoea sp. S62]|nr:hypothetical protein [Pantoea sp. S62]